jgi:hypothetical protein
MGHNKTTPAAWSLRRTRYDPPGLDEAITAARGLTDRVESQIEIAAQLMGLPEDDVRHRVLMVQAQTTPKRIGPVQRQTAEVVVVKRRVMRANLS